MTTQSLYVSCEFSRAVFVYYGAEGPHIFLNRALLRLNPALAVTIPHHAIDTYVSLDTMTHDCRRVEKRRIKECACGPRFALDGSQRVALVLIL